jgi:hypothetical protein
MGDKSFGGGHHNLVTLRSICLASELITHENGNGIIILENSWVIPI